MFTICGSVGLLRPELAVMGAGVMDGLAQMLCAHGCKCGQHRESQFSSTAGIWGLTACAPDITAVTTRHHVQGMLYRCLQFVGVLPLFDRGCYSFKPYEAPWM